MGYVSEFSTDTHPSLPVKAVRNSDGVVLRDTVFVPRTDLRQQYGFRTGEGHQGLEAHKPVAESLDERGQWADKAQMIELLDELQRTTTTGRRRGSGSDVNYRDFWQTRTSPGTLRYTGWYLFGGKLDSASATGAIQIVDAPWTPPQSQASAQSWGASALRAAAPTRPDFNLTRFVGELKDTNRIFDPANYVPGNFRDLGGGYLNYQFGLTPTVSDVQRGAEAILKADHLTRDFVRRAFHSVKRSRILSSTSSTASGTRSLPSSVQTSSSSGVMFWSDPGDVGTARGKPNINFSASSSRTVRAGTYFEYFVGDPYGYTSRMDSYKEQAQKVLGGGLNLPTAYELLPFSWMVDWFFDIGSLLNYQQAVADYSLINRNGYVVSEAHSRAHATVVNGGTPGPGNLWSTDATGAASFTRREYHRTPGGMYDMSPTWNLNPFQWSIAAAMGLTKAYRVPALRGAL